MWERGGENIAKSNMWFVFFCTCACHLDKFISVNRTLVDFPLFYSEYLLPSNTWTMRFFTANIERNSMTPLRIQVHRVLTWCAQKKSMNFVSNFLELPKKVKKLPRKKWKNNFLCDALSTSCFMIPGNFDSFQRCVEASFAELKQKGSPYNLQKRVCRV